jgi:hypothetical protein
MADWAIGNRRQHHHHAREGRAAAPRRDPNAGNAPLDTRQAHSIPPETSMIKRFVPLALLAAWIPLAHAFPPCPVQPMEYGPPLDELSASNTARLPIEDAEPWFKAHYSFVGDPAVLDRIRGGGATDTIHDPNSGKCEAPDSLPVLSSHISAGNLQLDPTYAPVSGFGVIDLPYLPKVAIDGLDIEYRLRFMTDNGHLEDPNDWLDVAQLDFFRNRSAGLKYSEAISSIYRVRKTQRNRSHASIEIIESRAAPPGVDTKPARNDRLVALIPLKNDQTHTLISLRWTQSAKRSSGSSPLRDQYDIDVVFEVLDPSDRVLYTTQLPGQWASLLSIGLLDYNVADISTYENNPAIELSEMTFGAKRRY